MKEIEELKKNLVMWLEEHPDVIKQITEGMQSITSGVIKHMKANYQARINMYPILKKELIPLAQRGWLISGYFGMSDLYELSEFISTCDANHLDQHVKELYRDDFENHVQEILKDYPEREFAIKPAINAHKRGEYALSVPIFFAQTDGICFEKMKKNLFQNRDHISTLAKVNITTSDTAYVDNSIVYTFISEILWTQLIDELPIGYNEKKRKDNSYFGLNRNTVLHGIAMDEYATEENSLKAFSLLSCIACLGV